MILLLTINVGLLILIALFGSRYDGSTREASFSVGLQGIKKEDVSKVTDIIWATLNKVARLALVSYHMHAVQDHSIQTHDFIFLTPTPEYHIIVLS